MVEAGEFIPGDGEVIEGIASVDESAITGESAPKSAGQPETLTVTGLTPSTTYYFALKIADEIPNWSALSNA